MHLFAVQRILGILLGLFSLTMVPPLAVSWFYADGKLTSFAIAFALVLGGGFLLWFPVRRHRRELRLRDGFLVVVAFWVVLGLSGAVPFLLLDDPSMTVADAVFEAVSGLTTTGATVITGIDSLPRSLLFYRQMLQWLGGMGIIVLAVAILPVLGIGGLQLYRAETPGPMKDQKLTPRITETAKALWYIYLGLTILCAIGYRRRGWTGSTPSRTASRRSRSGGSRPTTRASGTSRTRPSRGWRWCSWPLPESTSRSTSSRGGREAPPRTCRMPSSGPMSTSLPR